MNDNIRSRMMDHVCKQMPERLLSIMLVMMVMIVPAVVVMMMIWFSFLMVVVRHQGMDQRK